MPHTKSAEKNLRKSEKRQRYNRNVKKDVKVQLRSFEAVLGTVEAQVELNKVYKRLDKAAARGVIHPNTAARQKSQMSKRLTVAKNAPPVVAKVGGKAAAKAGAKTGSKKAKS
ncbi:MAG: 30S ribosomal protein S20 [Planctomycetota bacterium]|nr:30S ribosomal protein S20 [Planctomycetota bacterium]